MSDISTNAFMAAIDHFVARRGVPSDIYSDCGTNFVGANRQFQVLINSPVGQATLVQSRAQCEWKFNPPSASHFEGL